MDNIFENELLDGEYIVWQGRPSKPFFFIGTDATMTPFGLLFFGFSLFWMAGALSHVVGAPPEKISPINMFFPVFGIPFVLVGLHMAFGRFWQRRRILKTIQYAVTNRRVMIARKKLWGGVEVDSKDINLITGMSKTQNANGIGDLLFEKAASASEMFASGGMNPLSQMALPQTFAFWHIEDVHTVYALVEKQKIAK